MGEVREEIGEGTALGGDGSGNLAWKTAKSGLWVFLLRVIQELVRLGKILILARLLSPQDFGLLGIALLCLAVLETFTTTGFEEALIQKRKNVADYLNSVWTAHIVRGTILFLLLFLVAPLAAAFFKSSDSAPVIRALAVTFLVQGFNNIGTVYFRKNLQFNRYFVLEFIGVVTDFVVAVVAVLMLRNVWALVLGLISSSVAKCAASYLVHPYRPRLSLDTGMISELWKFGGWVLGSTIILFLVTQGDDILVGRMLGAAALGFYQLAYRISNMPTTEITHVISIVTFPAYSKIQDQRQRLADAYLRVLRITSFLSFLASILIFLLAKDFTVLFLGDKWIPIIRAMQILVVAGLTRSILATTGPLFYAMGKPRLDTVFQVLRLILLALAIYPLIRLWGINGASLAVTISNSVSCAVFCVVAVKVTRCGAGKFLKAMAIPGLSSLSAWLLFLALDERIAFSVSGFMLKAGACAAAYFLTTVLTMKFLRYEILDDARATIRSRREARLLVEEPYSAGHEG